MKHLLILIALIPSFLFAQELSQFNQQRNQIDKKLMTSLGSWAIVNFVGSGYGWATSTNSEVKSFHQMNVMWNTVNFALAVPGYLKAKQNNTDLTLSESILAQHKTEKIFLFNAGLDLGYITSGFLLRSMANNNLSRKDQFNGFGSGLILQGSFLMIFDLTAFIVHKNHANKSLNKLLKNLDASSSGLGISLRF
jgi:hypothetical protein